jgi:hypothetical protein
MRGMKRLTLLAYGGGFVVSVAGCATIVSGRTAEVKLNSTPPEANVVVYDHEGNAVAQTMTPGKVLLKRGRPWLRPARYTAAFSKEGYASVETPINTKFNPWSLGNIVLGGPIGVGVDAVSGALWRPTDATIEQTLAADNGGAYTSDLELTGAEEELAMPGQ